MFIAKFMSSVAGRVVRIIAGVALIAIGLALGGTGGGVLAIVGLLPLLAGVFDFCVIGALFGAPLQGSKVRARVK